MQVLISKNHEVALAFPQQNKHEVLKIIQKNLSNIIHNKKFNTLQIRQGRVILTDSFWDRRKVSMCKASNLTAVWRTANILARQVT
jgi:hypothetical protein